MELRPRPSSARRYAERLLRFRLPLLVVLIALALFLSHDLLWAAWEWGAVVPMEINWGWNAWRAGSVDLSPFWSQLLLPTVGWIAWLLGRWITHRAEGGGLLLLALVGFLPAVIGWPIDFVLGGALLLAAAGALAILFRPGAPLGVLFVLGTFFAMLPSMGGSLALVIAGGGYREVALVPLFALSILSGELLFASGVIARPRSPKPNGKALAAHWLENHLHSLSVAWLLAVAAMLLTALVAGLLHDRILLLAVTSFAAIWILLTLLFPLLLTLLPGKPQSGR